MYEATYDATYLGAAKRIIDYLLSQTDEERGVVDYRGVSGPVWREGAATSVSHVNLANRHGQTVLQLRCVPPNSDRAEVDLTTSEGRYSLTLRHPERNLLRLVSVSSDPADDRFVEDALISESSSAHAWSATVFRAEAPASTRTGFIEQFTATPGATGVLTYPMALWARLADDAQLSNVLGVHEVVAKIEEATAYFDVNWRQDADGGGNWVIPKGQPTRFDGVGLPWNQAHALGATEVELYRLTGNSKYRGRVERLVTAWRAGWERVQAWPQWRRWPRDNPVFTGYTHDEEVSINSPARSPFTEWEDLTHGALSMEFATAAAEARIGLDQDDLASLARSFTEGILSPRGVRERFDGKGVPAVEWAHAAQWLAISDQEVARQVHRLLSGQRSVPSTPVGLLACGYLNLARSRGVL
jgi:hypothetical protein